MANIKSAKKRILVNQERAARNKAIKSGVKTAIKKVYAAIDANDQAAAKAATEAQAEVTKANNAAIAAANKAAVEAMNAEKVAAQKAALAALGLL